MTNNAAAPIGFRGGVGRGAEEPEGVVWLETVAEVEAGASDEEDAANADESPPLAGSLAFRTFTTCVSTLGRLDCDPPPPKKSMRFFADFAGTKLSTAGLCISAMPLGETWELASFLRVEDEACGFRCCGSAARWAFGCPLGYAPGRTSRRGTRGGGSLGPGVGDARREVDSDVEAEPGFR